MHETPTAAQVGAARQLHVSQPLESRVKPYGHAMLHVAPGQLTE